MQILNQTTRSLEFQVASHTSETLWTVPIEANEGVSKDLSDADAPFTVYARWASTPPMSYNFAPSGSGGGQVQRNASTVTITNAFGEFPGAVS